MNKIGQGMIPRGQRVLILVKFGSFGFEFGMDQVNNLKVK